MNKCMCGAEDCKHYNVFDGKLIEKDPNKEYHKWESKDIEDFKDKIMEKNAKAFLEDGMY